MATKTSAGIGRGRRRASAKSAVIPKPSNIAHVKTMCATCNLRELCPPCCGLTSFEMAVANRLMFNRTKVRRGESLYRTGDRFKSLFAVRNGFFKSTILLEDGRRDQVTGFSMTGEILGMDGIGSERHTCNSVALEDSDVCAIPFVGLQKLAREISSLQRQFQRMMSREIVREQGVMLLLGRMNAEERLAVFLLNLSQRFAAHGCSPLKFYLPMTRQDIGSFLGLTLETVSRTLSKFHDEGILSVRRKFICILDNAGLGRVMGRDPD